MTKKILSMLLVSSMMVACGSSGSNKSSNHAKPIISSAVSSSSISSSVATSSSSNSSANSSASSSTSSTEVPSACTKINTVQGFASLNGGTTGGADLGAGNHIVIATTGSQISAALTHAQYATLPLTIYVDGLITWENSNSAPIRIRRKNVSIIGRYAGEFFGVGIELSHGASNIIIRNLKMHEVPQSRGAGDIISLIGKNGPVRNVWIDHNELYNNLSTPNCSTETCHKDYFDELVSGRADVSDVTISYNYLHDSWKTSLWGSSDAGEVGDTNRRITFHNNYWYKTNSRLPLFRFGEAHIFNNYYHQINGSGINPRMGAVMRIDGNHFDYVKNPIVSIDSRDLGFWTVDDNLFTHITTSNGSCLSNSPPCYNAHTKSTIGEHMPPYHYDLLPATEVKAEVTANAGAYKINTCLGFPEVTSSSSASSTINTHGPTAWNIYNADVLPGTSGSISLATGGVTEFAIGGNEDGLTYPAFKVEGETGTVSFDTSANKDLTHHASLNSVVNNNKIYPKYFTLLAGISGNTGDARGLEIEVAMADMAEPGSRVKMLIRPEQGGVQLENANAGNSVASYQSPGSAIPMDGFRIYQLSIELLTATTGSVMVYADGQDTPMTNLSLTDVVMRATSGTGNNYLRIGDGGAQPYKATIDWLIWTNEASYTPSQLKGLLPPGIGQTDSYVPD